MENTTVSTIVPKDEHMIGQAFKNLNSFKRFRALADIERDKGNIDKANYYELQMYKTFDQLELSLRGLQREIKSNN